MCAVPRVCVRVCVWVCVSVDISMRVRARAGVNFDELARSTEDFNGAMLKAVCVEAGMLALRRGASVINHEDFVEGISQVQLKKKQSLQVRVCVCCPLPPSVPPLCSRGLRVVVCDRVLRCVQYYA